MSATKRVDYTQISNSDSLHCFFLYSGDDNINLAGGPSKFVTDVVVDDRGMCRWGGPATFKVNCKMKIDQWPFDEQQCKLGFGSYTFGKNLLKLKLFKDKSKLTSKLQAGCIDCTFRWNAVLSSLISVTNRCCFQGISPTPSLGLGASQFPFCNFSIRWGFSTAVTELHWHIILEDVNYNWEAQNFVGICLLGLLE